MAPVVRGAPTPSCPRKPHRGSKVTRYGRRVVDGVEQQRYRCVPEEGDAHVFSLLPGGIAPQTYLPPEPCPRHPGSHVVRDGTYRRAGADRQQYRCTPKKGASHRFTPALPRERVHDGDRCEHCLEHRGVHRGETATARGHRATTSLVVDSLRRLADGESYGAVAVRARLAMGWDVEANGEPSRQSSWRLAADWVEVFSPVLWEPFDARMRQRALERRADPHRQPTVLVIDDVPMFRGAKAISGRGQRYAVLSAAEVDWDAKGQRRHRVRLIRAYPTHGTAAYKMLLDELGYVPDFIVADAGAGLVPALSWLRARHPEQTFTWVVSAHHIRVQLTRSLTKSTAKWPRFQPGDLLDELTSLSCLNSVAAWESWWARLLRRMDAQGLPAANRFANWMRDYKPAVDEALAELEHWPQVPRSTGGLEKLASNEIAPKLVGRAHGFGNLARTNALLDLITLRLNAELDNPAQLAEQLRADARANKGFAPPVRSITDPGMYRSLLDKDRLRALVDKHGLT